MKIFAAQGMKTASVLRIDEAMASERLPHVGVREPRNERVSQASRTLSFLPVRGHSTKLCAPQKNNWATGMPAP